MNRRCVLAALTLFLCARPIHAAVSSTIAVQGSIGQGGTSGTSKPPGTKDGVTDTFVLRSAGDESIGNGALMGTTGAMTEKAHACSGPPPGNPGGSGNGNNRATVNYAETFSIVSTSLPPDTPVLINLKVAAARSFRAFVIQPDQPLQAGSANTRGDAFIGFNTEQASGNFQGSFSAGQMNTGDLFTSSTGIFAHPFIKPGEKETDPSAMESTFTLAGVVGGHFSFDLETQTSATSGAIFPITTDGDGQMSLEWGADVVGGQARLQTSDGTGTFPGTSNVSGDNALADLPPPPMEMDAPEPAALALGAGPLLALLLRRRSARR